MPAETADNMRRVSGGVADRMHIGNHLRACIAKRAPGIPRLLEETKIFGAVHAGARSLTENSRCNQIVPAGLQPCQQAVGAFRLLGGALDDAAHQKELRIVAAMLFGVDGLHAGTPLVGIRSPPRGYDIASGSSPWASQWATAIPSPGWQRVPNWKAWRSDKSFSRLW